MTDQSKEQKPEMKNWFDKILEKEGIKVQKVDPPKDFLRVMFPGNLPGFAVGSAAVRAHSNENKKD